MKDRPTDDQIVNVYLRAHRTGMRLKDLADELGTSLSYLNWRVKVLRKAGVRIPRLNWNGLSPNEVTELNRIIEEMSSINQRKE